MLRRTNYFALIFTGIFEIKRGALCPAGPRLGSRTAAGCSAATLSFSAAGAQVNYSTTGIFNFVQGGTARFQLNVATLEGMADFPAVAPIPEPSTYALMIGGLALVAVAARRRRPSREL